MDRISLMKPKLNDEDVEKIVKNENTWFMGLVPPRNFRIDGFQDVYIPYLLTGVCYYRKMNQRRKCYIFSNLEQGIKSGVVEINNLEFVEMDAPAGLRPISVDEEAHKAEIVHYCNFDLLVKNYRKYINWTIEVLEIKKMYRLKRVVNYTVNGRPKNKSIFLDSMILK